MQISETDFIHAKKSSGLKKKNRKKYKCEKNDVCIGCFSMFSPS